MGAEGRTGKYLARGQDVRTIHYNTLFQNDAVMSRIERSYEKS